MKKLIINFCAFLIFCSNFTSLALAHHPLAGKQMVNFNDGFLSGIAHPLIGFDHLFFILGVGIICFLAKRIYIGPLFFVLGMSGGLFLIIMGYQLPEVELVISLSLLLSGVVIFAWKKTNFNYIATAFCIIGLFHGWAFGETIIDQESSNITIVSGYILGLSLMIWLISSFSGLTFKNISKLSDENDSKVKISGGIIAGIGIFLILEDIENRVISLLV